MKQIIITGAASGIGYATAKLCVANDYRVIACDSNVAALHNLQSEFDSSHVSAHVFDVSDYKQVETFFAQLNKDAWPTSLINNAGIYLAKNLLDYTAEDMQCVMNVNINGAMSMTQFFARTLMANQQVGSIINMSSVAQYGGSDAVYGASKGALAAFTRCCAINFSPYIRVNAVAPGIVSETTMHADLPAPVSQWYQENELIKKPLQVNDVAKTVLFLLSDDAAHYTGATFDLNNGFHRH